MNRYLKNTPDELEMAILRDWLQEKENQNNDLKTKVEQLQREVHQKNLELVILQKRLAKQESLKEEDKAAADHKRWNQEIKRNSFSTTTTAHSSSASKEKSWDQDENARYDSYSTEPHKNHQTGRKTLTTPQSNHGIENILTHESMSEDTSSEWNDKFDETFKMRPGRNQRKISTAAAQASNSISNLAENDGKATLQFRQVLQRGSSYHSLQSNTYEDDVSCLTLPSVFRTSVSSTGVESCQEVQDYPLCDPYGDTGKYTGIILKSTRMPHGAGRMEYDDKSKTYEGNWKYGRWHGTGKATLSNGDFYEGEYRLDQRHGKGKFVWSDGRVYEGEFKDDKEKGKGLMTWPNGASYYGDFHNGKREGEGKFTYPHGGYYIGSWKNDHYDGIGGKELHWKMQNVTNLFIAHLILMIFNFLRMSMERWPTL
jgi:hypothetical protein